MVAVGSKVPTRESSSFATPWHFRNPTRCRAINADTDTITDTDTVTGYVCSNRDSYQRHMQTQIQVKMHIPNTETDGNAIKDTATDTVQIYKNVDRDTLTDTDTDFKVRSKLPMLQQKFLQIPRSTSRKLNKDIDRH